MNWPGFHNPAHKTPLAHLVEVADWIAYVTARMILPGLDRIERNQGTLMSAFTDLKTAVETYIAAVEVYKANVAQMIADAVAKDDADEDVDLKALQSEVDAAGASLNPPVVPPAV